MSGTGTGVLVSVRLTSLRCLLSDGLRSEGLGIPSPLLGCHGRYGPEGPLQWLVPGWYCWLLCTSCCVPFPGWQALMLGILAGTDLKYICSGMYKAGFLVFLHLVLFARGVQENWIIWEMACILLLRPLVSGSHLFVLLPEEYRVAYFREMMTPGNVSSIQHYSWFNSGYMFGISLEAFMEEVHAFLREGRTFGS